MLFKLRQQLHRVRFTASNRLPFRTARLYLLQELREARHTHPSPWRRAAAGVLRLKLIRKFHNENRQALRVGCFLTGRARGLSRRYSIARTKVKSFSDEGLLLGLRKASW